MWNEVVNKIDIKTQHMYLCAYNIYMYMHKNNIIENLTFVSRQLQANKTLLSFDNSYMKWKFVIYKFLTALLYLNE